MNKIARLIQIYKDEGLKELISSVKKYLSNKVSSFTNKFQFYIYRILGKDSKIHKIGDIEVKTPIRDYYQFTRFGSIHDEENLIEDILSELRPDDVFYDIGAYYGWHTLAAAAKLNHGEVICFEPHPSSYQRLLETTNFSIYENIENYNYALSNQKKLAKMAESAGPGGKITSEDSEENSIEIEAIVGDEFIQENDLPQPNVIKIDVEGWEVNCLQGLNQSISKQNCRLLYCELHSHKAKEGDEVREKVIEIIKHNGFEIKEIKHHEKDLIKAKKPLDKNYRV